MRVGIIGVGAISHKHAQAYSNIGYQVVACSGFDHGRIKAFASQYGCEPIEQWQDLCRHPGIDFVDVCTFPSFRLEPVELCARTKKHVQVQKPIATNLKTARRMIETASAGGILLSVVSQHRFDESSQFLKTAIDDGQIGRILQADAYVKWYRPAEYYARLGKGTWETEGGGVLINQAIHQIDLLLWLAGAARHVYGEWSLAAVHKIESEDIVTAMVRYDSGAAGVIQASTALWPGHSERLEIHGTNGTAIVTGDQLTTWEVKNDSGSPPPTFVLPASGASDPMALSLTPFERQFLDFGEAILANRLPLVSGEEGYRALQVVDAIYRSCRRNERIVLDR